MGKICRLQQTQYLPLFRRRSNLKWSSQNEKSTSEKRMTIVPAREVSDGVFLRTRVGQ